MYNIRGLFERVILFIYQIAGNERCRKRNIGDSSICLILFLKIDFLYSCNRNCTLKQIETAVYVN